MSQNTYENPVFHTTQEDIECANNIDLEKKSTEDEKEDDVINKNIIYGVEDVPPWHLCFLFGFQHYMIMAGSMIGIPSIVAPLFCVPDSDPARGQLISTILFCSGIVTFLQSTFGVRLPIIQGGTIAFLAPTIAIVTTSFPSCDTYDLSNMTQFDIDEMWMSRMREIQGDIIVASLFQIIIGYTGAIGFFLTWITPLTIVPTITLVGLSLFQAAANQAAGQWGIALLTSFLLVLFSQYLANVGIPFPTFSKKKFQLTKYKIFSFFPVILAIFFSWTVCGILTATDVLPSNSTARTDTNLGLIGKSPWFYVPYPFQWGIPTVSLSGFFGMLAGVIASMIESVGDYYACARLSGAKVPPKHAINRGIGTEGLGCMIAGLIGTGNGTTSYSENIGAIRVTRVASRRVIQTAAFLMIICGLFGKFGAFFGTLPTPVIGGVFLIMFGIITAVGLSNLQVVDLNSSRNIFVLGISIFFGLSIPHWVSNNNDRISTGYLALDQIITVLLSTQMFVGGAIGLVLDNTIPGTDEERGLIKWKEESGGTSKEENESDISCYDLPFGMNFIKRNIWCSRIPISPTYNGIKATKDNT